MSCYRPEDVIRFVAGALGGASLVAMEAHIEACQACFLQVAAAAADVSDNERRELRSRVPQASRLARSLAPPSALTTLAGAEEPDTGEALRRTIGPYTLTGMLGVGGMSIVYRGRHQGTGREVAIKAVRTPFVAAYLAMLRQEVEFLREAKHPGIVSVLDFDLTAGDPWYAMELFEGPTLREYNQRLWPVDGGDMDAPAEVPRAAGGRLAEVLRLYARLCHPVAFINGAGLVHGDLKPANVFLRDQLQPVVMDFGLASKAKGTVGRDALDVTGKIRGTLPYIAPETIRGQLPDARTDVYALGCMLYETLVGAPPFVSRSGAEIVDMHLRAEPLPVGRRVRGVPPALDDLMGRLLAKLPEARFGHASALGHALETIAAGLDGSVAEVAGHAPLVSEAGMPLFRPPLVGRVRELSAIADRLQRSDAQTGGLVLVSGESGIGKTFLVSEVAQRALIGGTHVITGECLPLSARSDAPSDAGSAPLQPFRRFFQSLRDRCHARGAGEVQALFGARLPLLSAYLPALATLPTHEGQPEPPRALPAPAARERIVAAVVDTLLAYAGRRPVMLALDDLQWADDLSLAVLDRLDAPECAAVPLLVVGTYRSDEAPEALQRLARKPGVHDLRLGRLGPDEVRAMIGGMLSMAVCPDALVAYVHQHSEGVPFFVAEYLRAMLAAGALRYRDGAWQTTSSGDSLPSAVPGSLQELLRGRVARQPAAARDALDGAAVVGRQFSASLLARMGNRPAREITAALAHAAAAQLIETDGFDGYRFAHDKLRETIYDGLPVARRRELHAQAARAMEDEEPTPPEWFGALARHHEQSGNAERAVERLAQAGQHALAMAAYADADRFLREALQLEADLPQRRPAVERARWLRERADALQGLGQMDASAAVLKQSAALLGRPFPQSKAGFGLRLTREMARQTWHRVRPTGIAAAGAEQRDAVAETVRVFGRMVRAAFYLGRDDDLVYASTVSLNESERLGACPDLTIAYTNAAMMAGVMPARGLAEKYLTLASRSLTEVTDPEAQTWLLQGEAAYRTWSGDRARALICLGAAAEVARTQGYYRRWDEVECARVGLDLFAGYHARIAERLEEVVVRARRRRDLQIQVWTTVQRVEAAVIRGEHEAAQSALNEIEDVLPSSSRPDRIWAYGLAAYVQWQLGAAEAAEQTAREALALMEQGPPVHNHCIDSYARLAEAALLMTAQAGSGSARAARLDLARRACKVLTRAARVFPIARPQAALHSGRLDLYRGRARPAGVIARWTEAIELARALTLPYHELRLHQALLGVLPTSDARHALHAASVERLLVDLELTPGASGTQPTAESSGRRVEVERQPQAQA